MSTYNTLLATMRCPHCCNVTDVQIDFRFGLRDQTDYRVGDTLQWEGRGTRTPSQRPPNGDFDGEGYAECPLCGRSYWSRILVKEDVLSDVAVDWDREEYPCEP